MKYRSITISGPVASGTTTAAKASAAKLNLEYHSAGDFFRKYMLEYDIPLHNKAKIPDELEREIDSKLAHLANRGGVVIDGHYTGYITRNIPHVLRVLLTADEAVRMQRAKVRIHTHTETEEEIKLREEGLDKKFRKLYADEDFLDPKFFDLVVDTTNITQEETVNQILQKFSTGSNNK